MNSNADFSMIAALDLEPIKVKLMHKEAGEGWSLERATAVELEYRRFLYLMKLFPHEPTAPLLDVDIFWHHHILDTMKYAQDCEQLFGYFLHHVPDDGSRGADDEAVRRQAGGRMQALYEATFGEAYIRPADGGSWCQPATQAGAWCQPATQAAAWCQPATQAAAWCQPATATGAECQAATGNHAWCQPAAPETAWCQPATQAAAWCQPAAPQTSWCQPAIAAKTAWCQPAAPTMAWCQPAIASSARPASNDKFHSSRGVAEAA